MKAFVHFLFNFAALYFKLPSCKPLRQLHHRQTHKYPTELSFLCWNSSLSTAEKKQLDKFIRKSSSVLGCPLTPVQVVGDRRTLAKLTSLVDSVSHPWHDAVEELQSPFQQQTAQSFIAGPSSQQLLGFITITTPNKHNKQFIVQ